MRDELLMRFKNILEENEVDRDRLVDEANYIIEQEDISVEELQELIDSERTDLENNLIYIEAEESSLDIEEKGILYQAEDKIDVLDFQLIHYI